MTGDRSPQGAADRERSRRLALVGKANPMALAQLNYARTPGWDAFFGSLQDNEDEANAAGMGYRSNLSGIGQRPDYSGGGRLTASDRTGIAENVALGDLADQNRARLLSDQAMAQQMQQDAINGMETGYEKQVLASAVPHGPAPITRETGDASGGLGYTMRPSPEETPQQRLASLLPGEAQPAFAAQTDAEALALRKQTEAERAATANEAIATSSVLPDDALDDAADRYNKTGIMPALGQKDPGNRARILKRAAERGRAGGADGVDISANAADYKADAGSLTALQKQRDAVGAFENTALKNLDTFIDLAGKVPDTGSPALNMPLRAVSEKMFGSEGLTAYNAARRTVIPEFAKILSNPTLSGQLSDSARHEVEEVLSGNATLKQVIAVANVLKQDARNRRTSYDDQIATVKDRIRKPGGAAPAAPAAAPPSGGAPRTNPFRK